MVVSFNFVRTVEVCCLLVTMLIDSEYRSERDSVPNLGTHLVISLTSCGWFDVFTSLNGFKVVVYDKIN